MKKVRPAFYHSTLRSVLTLDKFVFTHGFIDITLCTAPLIFNMSENISKQQGLIRVQFFHGGRE